MAGRGRIETCIFILGGIEEMVEIMRRPRIIRETARGLETMSLEDDFFQKREIFLTTGIEAEVSTELIKQLL